MSSSPIFHQRTNDDNTSRLFSKFFAVTIMFLQRKFIIVFGFSTKTTIIFLPSHSQFAVVVVAIVAASSGRKKEEKKTKSATDKRSKTRSRRRRTSSTSSDIANKWGSGSSRSGKIYCWSFCDDDDQRHCIRLTQDKSRDKIYPAWLSGNERIITFDFKCACTVRDYCHRQRHRCHHPGSGKARGK